VHLWYTHRALELLVSIHGYGVGISEPWECACKRKGTSPGCVHMEVASVFFCQARHTRKIVNRSGLCRSQHTYDGHNRNAFSTALAQLYTKEFDVDPEGSIHRDLANASAAKAEHGARLLDGVVHEFGPQDDPPARKPVLCCLGKDLRTRHEEGLQVAHGPTRCKDTKAAVSCLGVLLVKSLLAVEDLVVKHSDSLALQKRHSLGGFHLDNIKIRRGDEGAHWSYVRRERRRHVSRHRRAAEVHLAGKDGAGEPLEVLVGTLLRIFGNLPAREELLYLLKRHVFQGHACLHRAALVVLNGLRVHT
jgi:hypothetical protein